MKLLVLMPLDGCTVDTCDWSLPGRRERKLSVMLPLDGANYC